MCVENGSKGKYICFHAPYTRFTSAILRLGDVQTRSSFRKTSYEIKIYFNSYISVSNKEYLIFL